MRKSYKEILRDLLKHYGYITVDFGTGEVTSDPMFKNCLDISEDNDYGI